MVVIIQQMEFSPLCPLNSFSVAEYICKYFFWNIWLEIRHFWSDGVDTEKGKQWKLHKITQNINIYYIYI